MTHFSLFFFTNGTKSARYVGGEFAYSGLRLEKETGSFLSCNCNERNDIPIYTPVYRITAFKAARIRM